MVLPSSGKPPYAASINIFHTTKPRQGELTRFLTCIFIALWFTMGFIEMHNGDLFHTVTSFTIAAWNISFLRDTIRIEKKVNRIDAQI